MDNNQAIVLSELKLKLKRVSVLDRRLQVFGATQHRYKSRPVCTAELERLERELGVCLPADYRQFLQVIGYGAGPYYGLYSPDEILRSFKGDYTFEEAPPSAPSRSFPFGHEQAEDCWRIMSERRHAEFQTNGPADGCIPICHEGCSSWSMLVTAGELAGNVWSWSVWSYPDYFYNLAPPPPGIDLSASVGPEPALSPAPTFLDWYSAWLDQCLSDLEKLKRGQTCETGGRVRDATGNTSATQRTEAAKDTSWVWKVVDLLRKKG